MKRLAVALFLVCLVMIFAVAPVMAMSQTSGGEITDPIQLYVIGVLASALLYALKIVAKRWPRFVIKREWLTVGLYVISLGLAMVWGGVTLPTFAHFSDPLTFVAALFGFASDLLVVLAVPVSFATLIYNVLLKRVFDEWARGRLIQAPLAGTVGTRGRRK